MRRIKALQEEAGNPKIDNARLRQVRDEITAEANTLKNLEQQYARTMQMADLAGQAIGASIRGVGRGMAAIARSITALVTNAMRFGVSAAGQIGRAFLTAARSVGNAMVNMGRRAMSVLGSVMRGTGNLMATIGKSIGTLFINRIKGAGEATEGFGGKIYGLLRNLAVFQLLKKAFESLISYVKEGVAEYIASDNQLKSAVDSLMTSLNNLKGTLGSAFAPIITAVVPVLQTLVNWCITAANAVAALIAALTGRSTYKIAVAGLGGVASGAGGAAENLANAAGAAKDLKKELAGYDELNVIQDNKSGGGGGGGGGAGAGGAGSITYADANIGSEIAEFAEKIKKAWLNADFTEIGKTIGTKLNQALQAIPWDKIQVNAQKIGKSLATLINGSVSVEDFGTTIGNTLAQALNTGLVTLEGFTTNLDFRKVGQFISDGINGVLENIKWESAVASAGSLGEGIAAVMNETITSRTFANVGKTVANAVNTAVAGASSYIRTADFARYGTAISTAIQTTISNIKWSDIRITATDFGAKIAQGLNSLLRADTFKSIGTTVANLVNTAIAGASSFLNSANFGSWGTSVSTGINTALSKIEWGSALTAAATFGNKIASALNGLLTVEMFSSVGTTVANAINTAILNGKSFFGSANFAQYGQAVGSGIVSALNLIRWEDAKLGFQNFTKGIAEFMNSLFTKDTFTAVGETVAEAVNAAIVGARTYFDAADFAQYGQAVGSAIISALNMISWDNAKLGFQSFAGKLADFLNNFFTSDMFESVGATVAEAVNTAVAGARTFFEAADFYQYGQALGSAVISAINLIDWESAALGFKTFTGKIADALNGFMTADKFSAVGEALADAVQTVLEGAYEFVSDADWKQWGNAIASGINTFFNNLDWKTVGLTLTQAAFGILNLMREAVSNISWFSLGHDLAEAIKKIDWGMVLKGAADLVVSIFKGLLDFGEGFTADSWKIYMQGVKNSTKELQEEHEKVKGVIEDAKTWDDAGSTPDFKYLENLAQKYGELAGKQTKSNDEIERLKRISSKLKEAIPELTEYYDEHTGLLTTNTNAIYDMINAMKAEAIQAAAMKSMEDLYQAEANALVTREKATAQYTELLGKYSANEREINKLVEANRILEAERLNSSESSEVYTAKIQENTNAIAALEKENIDLSGAMSDQKDVIDESNAAYTSAEAEIQNITKYLTAQANTTKTASTNTEELVNKVSSINKAFKDLSKNSQISIQASLAGFDSYLTTDQKISVIAEVTGVDASTLPKDKRKIDQMYGEIVDAYSKEGVKATVDASGKVTSAKDATGGKTEVATKGNIKSATDNTPKPTPVNATGMLHSAVDKTGGKSVVAGSQNTTKAADKTGGKSVVTGSQNTTKATDKTGGKSTVAGSLTATTVKDSIPATSKNITGMKANFGGWQKGATFSSLMAMSSNFTGWKRADSFVSAMAMTSNFTGWKRGDSFVSAMTMTSTFDKWLKAKGFNSSVGNMISVFEKKQLGGNFGTLIPQTAYMNKKQLAQNFGSLITQTAYFPTKQLGSSFGNNIEQTAWLTGKLLGGGFGMYIDQIANLSGKKDSIWDKDLDNFTAIIKNKDDQIPAWQRILNGFTALVQSVTRQAAGGIYQNGTWTDLAQFASGGVIRNGVASWWSHIPKYAGGTGRAHGTLFAAGEAGPEVVGHIGGRTEVLNKSQIASAIYQAVVAAVAGTVGLIVRPIIQTNVNCAEAVGSALYAVADQVRDLQYQPYRMDFVPDTSRINDANRSYSAAAPAINAAMQTGRNGAVQYVFTANLDGREIFREVVDQDSLFRSQTGRSAFA